MSFLGIAVFMRMKLRMILQRVDTFRSTLGLKKRKQLKLSVNLQSKKQRISKMSVCLNIRRVNSPCWQRVVVRLPYSYNYENNSGLVFVDILWTWGRNKGHKLVIKQVQQGLYKHLDLRPIIELNETDLKHLLNMFVIQ